MKTQTRAEKQSVAQRAVKAALAGFIHSKREIEGPAMFNVTHYDYAGEPVPPGVYANVRLFIPKKSIDTMLRRERAAKRRKR